LLDKLGRRVLRRQIHPPSYLSI